MSLAAIRNLSLGMGPGNKNITHYPKPTSSEFIKGFLRGLFDADASVQGSSKGHFDPAGQSDLERLQAVQRMLARFGIVSTIYANRRGKGPRCQMAARGAPLTRPGRSTAGHLRDNVAVFAEIIGFSETAKRERSRLLDSYGRSRIATLHLPLPPSNPAAAKRFMTAGSAPMPLTLTASWSITAANNRCSHMKPAAPARSTWVNLSARGKLIGTASSG